MVLGATSMKRQVLGRADIPGAVSEFGVAVSGYPLFGAVQGIVTSLLVTIGGTSALQQAAIGDAETDSADRTVKTPLETAGTNGRPHGVRSPTLPVTLGRSLPSG